MDNITIKRKKQEKIVPQDISIKIDTSSLEKKLEEKFTIEKSEKDELKDIIISERFNSLIEKYNDLQEKNSNISNMVQTLSLKIESLNEDLPTTIVEQYKNYLDKSNESITKFSEVINDFNDNNRNYKKHYEELVGIITEAEKNSDSVAEMLRAHIQNFNTDMTNLENTVKINQEVNSDNFKKISDRIKSEIEEITNKNDLLSGRLIIIQSELKEELISVNNKIENQKKETFDKFGNIENKINEENNNLFKKLSSDYEQAIKNYNKEIVSKEIKELKKQIKKGDKTISFLNDRFKEMGKRILDKVKISSEAILGQEDISNIIKGVVEQDLISLKSIVEDNDQNIKLISSDIKKLKTSIKKIEKEIVSTLDKDIETQLKKIEKEFNKKLDILETELKSSIDTKEFVIKREHLEQIVFENPDVFKGKDGAIPDHVVKGNFLFFQKPDGSWGDAIRLSGATTMPAIIGGASSGSVTYDGLKNFRELLDVIGGEFNTSGQLAVWDNILGKIRATHKINDTGTSTSDLWTADKIISHVSGVAGNYIPTSEKGQPDGVATLDENGKVPSSQLTIEALEYKGAWNANTNTPNLVDGTGNTGDFYVTSVEGTHTFGGVAIDFKVGDWVLFNGTIWEKTQNQDLSGFVPYTGADKTVDLGEENLELYNIITKGGSYEEDGISYRPGIIFQQELPIGFENMQPKIWGSNSVDNTWVETNRSFKTPNLSIGKAPPYEYDESIRFGAVGAYIDNKRDETELDMYASVQTNLKSPITQVDGSINVDGENIDIDSTDYSAKIVGNTVIGDLVDGRNHKYLRVGSYIEAFSDWTNYYNYCGMDGELATIYIYSTIATGYTPKIYLETDKTLFSFGNYNDEYFKLNSADADLLGTNGFNLSLANNFGIGMLPTGDRKLDVSGGLGVDNIQIDTTATPITDAEGLIQWNADDGTLDVGLANGVVGQMFMEDYYPVVNRTGATITNGTVVMFNGSEAIGNSGKFVIQKAIADGSIPSKYIMGIVTHDILDNGFGIVTSRGKVRGIDTTGGAENWVMGEILYLSATTAGLLTKTAPEAPNLKITVASVVGTPHANGTLWIRPTWECKVTDLDDVDGTPLTENGQIMVWDNDRGVFDFTENTTDFFKLDQTTPQTIINGTPIFDEGLIANDTVTINSADDTDLGGDNLQENGLILDGAVDTDKQILFRDNGVDKWAIQGAWRNEDARFMYFYNLDSEENPMVMSRNGRFGFNRPTSLVSEYVAYNGTGLNDVTASGNFEGNLTTAFRVYIDSIGATDTFRWEYSINAGGTGSTWTGGGTLIPCQVTPYELRQGVSIQFGSITGHSADDTWSVRGFSQEAPSTFDIKPPMVQRVMISEDDGATFTDYTYKAATTQCSIADSFQILQDATCYLYLGNASKWNAVSIILSQYGAGGTFKVQYLNGSDAWVDATGVIDETANLTTNGNLMWDNTTFIDWAKKTIDGSEKYWLRIIPVTAYSTIPEMSSIARHSFHRLSVYSAHNDLRPAFNVEGDGVTKMWEAERVSTAASYRNAEYITEQRLKEALSVYQDRISYLTNTISGTDKLLSLTAQASFSNTFSVSQNTQTELETWIEFEDAMNYRTSVEIGDRFDTYLYLQKTTANRGVTFQVDVVILDAVGTALHTYSSAELVAPLTTNIEAYDFLITANTQHTFVAGEKFAIRVKAKRSGTPLTTQNILIWGGGVYNSQLDYPSLKVTLDRLFLHFEEDQDTLKNQWKAKGTGTDYDIELVPKGAGIVRTTTDLTVVGDIVADNIPEVKQEIITITAGMIANKYIDLNQIPRDPTNVQLYLKNGTLQFNTIDFQVITDGVNIRRLSWNALDFEDLVEEDDVVSIIYTYNL